MENQVTKLCKHCQTEIPKKAKVCPNCKKKQNGVVKWIAIAVVVLILIGAMGSGQDEPEKVGEINVDTEIQIAESEKTTFTVGEIAEMNDVQVTMLSYEESDGADFVTPTEGNVFVLVEFEIANNSDSEIAVSSMLSFEAYADDYALNYSLSSLMVKEGATQLDGTIASGKKMKGIIGYEVPADWSNLEIHFTDNVWDDDSFVFVINK